MPIPSNQLFSTPRFRVLIADDDRSFADNLLMFLSNEYDVGVAYSGKDTLEKISQLNPDVVLLDIDFGCHPDGFEVLTEIVKERDAPVVIMVTGLNDIQAAIKSIKAGAFHFIHKEPDLVELMNLINLGAMHAHTRKQLKIREGDIKRLSGVFVVHDPAMVRILADLERVAATDTTVMITGETGTGKEMVARRIHELSPRTKGPFIAVNCGGISESLLESELFGHVKGAFTGAERDKAGYFQQARGGTLFLDEIGHASPGLQTRLLRVLESREYQKVGGEEVEIADVRILTASSRPLDQAVAEGSFKDELYYRLNVYPVVIPPLRHRKEDIIPIAEHYLSFFSAQMGRPPMELSSDAKAFLTRQPWPGNVRLLKNVLERAVINCRGSLIQVLHLVAPVSGLEAEMLPYDRAKARMLEDFKRKYIVEQLNRAGGNVTKAAEMSKLSRSSFSRMMTEMKISTGKEDPRDSKSEIFRG